MRSLRRLGRSVVAILLLAGAAVAVQAPVVAPAAAAVAACQGSDLTGDGYPDLAVGTPKEDVGAVADAGSVTVLLGGARGLGRSGAILLTQESLSEVSETNDHFGAAVAIGLLDGDTCPDLVIGVPGEDVAAGEVVVVPGSPSGLMSSAAVVLRQGSNGVPGTAEPGDEFGASAATGVFVAGEDGGGPDAPQLMIGAPMEDVGTVVDAGAVTVFDLRGGLDPVVATEVTQGSGGYSGVPEAGDHFGTAVAIGSGNRTRGGGLAMVGAPDEDVAGLVDAGVVHLDGWVVNQGKSARYPGRAEAGDRFGAAVAVLPAACDSDTNLWAASAPGEDIGGVRDAGAVTGRDWSLRQGSGGILGRPEPFDRFGSSLLSIPGPSGGWTLLVGTALEDIGSVVDAGSVTWIVDDCAKRVSELIDQGQPGVPSAPDRGDRFGASLGATSGSDATVAVGAPGEAAGSVAKAGALVLVPAANGRQAGPGRYVSQGSSGIPGASEAGDGFAARLTVP